ncbi:GNAT family N-acetyltransferase [Mucilaginibacter limnophilus]|uniref:GNAT family N-acetyltransferase n=1 Tax=Mucilaginibacter limnophilus TaxID=1932778 RepID=A0A3S2VNS4_9SPHI|nr:GNAT family N-acetyltransferase [Mucilaginibacter limnophilus]RVU01749.1 GNAT family N-acetyltransferase [Mucilaginibacter limnophilus]
MYFIREANINDAETIRQLAEETWWPTYSPILEAEQIKFMLADIYSTEKLAEQIAYNKQTYLLLIEDNVPVGFAAFSPREDNPTVYKLHKLYCLPAMQGKGYGRALIAEVEKRVKAAGFSALDLNVNRYNKAKGLYDKMGFKVIYEEDIPIGPYFMNDFVMRKEL